MGGGDGRMCARSPRSRYSCSVSDDSTGARPFEATVRPAYAIEPGHVVLILERYTGDVDVGDSIAVSHDGRAAEARVVNVAWGSTFGVEASPLTLVVAGLPRDGAFVGASLTSITSRA